MKISKNIELIGKSLYFLKEKILVISDLHIGFEEQIRLGGFYFPKTLFKTIITDLNKIFKKTGKVKKIIILGDLKHEFGRISKEEWRETHEVLKLMRKNTNEIILIRGNHDAILEPVIKKFDLTLKDYYIQDKFAFFHGHKLFNELYNTRNNIKTWIIGHKHPAITIRKGVKQEKYKCFLVGGYKDKKLIILPSFFPLTVGGEISIKDNHFGFKLNIKNFEVYVIDEGGKIYDFGKSKNFEKLN